MKFKNKFLVISLFLCVFIMPLISGEVYLWTDIKIDDSANTVTQHAYYQLEDSSASGITRHKDTEVVIWYVVEALQKNLTNSYVDWCNLSTIFIHNEYGTDFVAFEGFSGGELLNTTIIKESYYFENTGVVNTSQLSYLLRDRDSLTVDMKCHYNDSNYLYEENILVGRFDTFFSAFECAGCEDYTIEQLSEETERNQEITEKQLETYSLIQSVLEKNFLLWLYASWIVKIAFLIIAVTLIFLMILHLYEFFKDIGSKI
jgi:hypothetical protein